MSYCLDHPFSCLFLLTMNCIGAPSRTSLQASFWVSQHMWEKLNLYKKSDLYLDFMVDMSLCICVHSFSLLYVLGTSMPLNAYTSTIEQSKPKDIIFYNINIILIYWVSGADLIRFCMWKFFNFALFSSAWLCHHVGAPELWNSWFISQNYIGLYSGFCAFSCTLKNFTKKCQENLVAQRRDLKESCS